MEKRLSKKSSSSSSQSSRLLSYGVRGLSAVQPVARSLSLAVSRLAPCAASRVEPGRPLQLARWRLALLGHVPKELSSAVRPSLPLVALALASLLLVHVLLAFALPRLAHTASLELSALLQSSSQGTSKLLWALSRSSSETSMRVPFALLSSLSLLPPPRP